MALITTGRDALAKALCAGRDCCDDGCYAGRRAADALLASGVVLDAATLADDEALMFRMGCVEHEVEDPARVSDQMRAALTRIAAAETRNLATALSERAS